MRDRLEALRKEQEKLAGVADLPRLPDLDIVRIALPLSSSAPLDWNRVEAERVLQQRADAYFQFRHSSILEQDRDDTASLDWSSDSLQERSTSRELESLVSEFWEGSAELRGQFRQALDAITRNRTAARSTLKDFLREASKEIVVVPRVSWPESLNPVDFAWCPLSDKGVIGYALMVLLGNNELCRRLRRCKLDSCGDFFIAEGSDEGGPKRSYCSESHQAIARKLQNAKNQEKYRKKQRAKAKRARRRNKK